MTSFLRVPHPSVCCSNFQEYWYDGPRHDRVAINRQVTYFWYSFAWARRLNTRLEVAATFDEATELPPVCWPAMYYNPEGKDGNQIYSSSRFCCKKDNSIGRGITEEGIAKV